MTHAINPSDDEREYGNNDDYDDKFVHKEPIKDFNYYYWQLTQNTPEKQLLERIHQLHEKETSLGSESGMHSQKAAVLREARYIMLNAALEAEGKTPETPSDWEKNLAELDDIISKNPDYKLLARSKWPLGIGKFFTEEGAQSNTHQLIEEVKRYITERQQQPGPGPKS